MSLIDDASPEAFHANLIVPLKRAVAARKRGYFACEPDPAQETYWQEVASRTGGLAAVPATCDAALLLDRLAEYWNVSGDPMLSRLLPHLKRLQQSIADDNAGSGTAHAAEKVPDSVYPLF